MIRTWVMRAGPVVLLTVLVLSFAGVAHCGPVLDEILNYMYVDQGVPMAYDNCLFNVARTVTLTSSNPIGQTFVAGMDTEKIVRVRVYMQPGYNWQPGEGAEMVVWESPQKDTVVGRYTIWYDFRGYDFNVAEFEVNAPVKPGSTYYFELSYVGTGDGILCQIGVMNGQFNYDIRQRVVYVNAAAPDGGDGKSWATAFNSIQDAVDSMDSVVAGQGYQAGQVADFDVCFQTHGKRRMDRTGNLEKMFERFDLERPGLALVKQAVDVKDYETAISRLVSYFEARQSPVPIIHAETVPNPNPDFDRTAGDYAMQNTFFGDTAYGYVGPDINWRPEIAFDESGNVIASGFTMNRYGPRGTLANAYLGTGDDKYAGKLNDLLADWFRDNPPPEASKIGGAPLDDVWASLNTGIRISHRFIAYDRIHASPAFTTDVRMAYILDLADHCDTLIWNGADAGGNWSMTQNSALLSFALDFQEFKRWQVWMDTASQRLSLTINRDILADGIETESAPGYQRWMYYNPLVGIYNLLRERGIETEFSAELQDILEVQAEYFMHLVMPNNGSPMLGDWGDAAPHILVSDSALFNRPDMLYVGTQGQQGTAPTEVAKCYPSAGIVTMRSDWGNVGQPYDAARYLMCHGVHYGSHGHSDLNGITVYGYGREFLTDPGSHIYGSPEHVELCRAVSHNLMTIDGQDQNMMPDTPFRAWATSPIADYLSSWVPAYSAGSYHREIIYVRSNGGSALDYWIIRDKAEGSGSHSLEQRWHFRPATMNVSGSSVARTDFAEGGNLAIMQVTPSRLQLQQTTINSWIPRGTAEEPTVLPTMIYKVTAGLPAGIDTVLFPYPNAGAPPARLQVLQSSADGLDSVFKIVQGSVSDLIVLQRNPGERTISGENVSFTGDRLILRKVNGQPATAVLINGTRLIVNGQTVINVPQAQALETYTF